jgi:metal-responsive CopG/Arc/MetJ family transcriptional regulator
MEVVTIRFQEDILKRIDENLTQHNFNSRTEFIREAVRDKLEELNRDELVEEFLKLRGQAGKKTTIEDNRETKRIVSKELMAELEKRFS